ncbi:MAG: alkaline phosphatase family protein [Peptococcaceae bacterium]|nr:alkaline phosphatase family protein [Peptococcaceae bacterium]MBP3626130.1 alkaline phosphatase family protein [Peptococcaceae bacterium]
MGNLKRAMMIGLDAADPVQVRRLMDEGKMPNLKKLLDEGTANSNLAMIGCLPSVTPPNWCSIATGAWPRTHGITCYNNNTLGQSLKLETTNWDSSTVTAEFIWEAFAKEGKRSIMLNYCEAWPPRMTENDLTVMVDGAGVVPFLKCGVDYQKVVFFEEGDFAMEFTPHAVKSSNTDCVIMGDQFEEMKAQSMQVTRDDKLSWGGMDGVISYPAGVQDIEDTSSYEFERKKESYRPSMADKLKTPLKNPTNWKFELPEGAKEATILLAKSTVRRFAIFTASDGVNYDTVTLYKNKKTPEPLGQVVGVENWSDFIIDYYILDDVEHKVSYKIRLCDMAKDGSSAIVYFSHATDMDNLNYFYPREMGARLYEEVGPALQFASVDVRGDHKENDRIVFESYAKESNEWHAKAATWLFNEYPDWQLFFVHLHSIDNFQHWFIQETVPERNPEHAYYQELLDAVYTENDKFIGEMMKQLDGNTTIIVTSDHGCMPHDVGDEYPGIGSIGGATVKIMEDIGYTKTYRDEKGALQIDWENTKAVAKRSSYIYVNLKGRDPEGLVEPEDYEETVQDIIGKLYNYRDEHGKRVIAHCFTRDEMEYLGMGGVHCGDILYQLVPTFNNDHANTFSTVHHGGWSMQNLCILSGAGIKKGGYIDRPIRITDIVPTICHLTDTKMPGSVEGGIIYQALEDFEEAKFDRGDEWALPTGKRLVK